MPSKLDLRFCLPAGKAGMLNVRKKASTKNPEPKIQNLKPKTAFTLIEVLVVMTIIAVISTASLYYYQNAQEKAHDARRKADVKALRSALILARQDAPYYKSLAQFKNLVTEGYLKSFPMDYTNNKSCTAGSGCQADYMACMQVGAFPGQDYVYCYPYYPTTSTGAACNNASTSTYCTQFVLVACLENNNDPESDRDSSGNTPHPTCTNGSYPYQTAASYTLTSPN